MPGTKISWGLPPFTNLRLAQDAGQWSNYEQTFSGNGTTYSPSNLSLLNASAISGSGGLSQNGWAARLGIYDTGTLAAFPISGNTYPNSNPLMLGFYLANQTYPTTQSTYYQFNDDSTRATGKNVRMSGLTNWTYTNITAPFGQVKQHSTYPASNTGYFNTATQRWKMLWADSAYGVGVYERSTTTDIGFVLWNLGNGAGNASAPIVTTATEASLGIVYMGSIASLIKNFGTYKFILTGGRSTASTAQIRYKVHVVDTTTGITASPTQSASITMHTSNAVDCCTVHFGIDYKAWSVVSRGNSNLRANVIQYDRIANTITAQFALQTLHSLNRYSTYATAVPVSGSSLYNFNVYTGARSTNYNSNLYIRRTTHTATTLTLGTERTIASSGNNMRRDVACILEDDLSIGKVWLLVGYVAGTLSTTCLNLYVVEHDIATDTYTQVGATFTPTLAFTPGNEGSFGLQRMTNVYERPVNTIPNINTTDYYTTKICYVALSYSHSNSDVTPAVVEVLRIPYSTALYHPSSPTPAVTIRDKAEMVLRLNYVAGSTILDSATGLTPFFNDFNHDLTFPSVQFRGAAGNYGLAYATTKLNGSNRDPYFFSTYFS